MSGIAGLINMHGRRSIQPFALKAMSQALAHRGPDGEDIYTEAGLSVAFRRLGPVDPIRLPLSNEDRTVHAWYDGQIYGLQEQRAQLEARGHSFQTPCLAEALPHLWEEHGFAIFDHLQGQFALVIWDSNSQRLILARDRFGIVPLVWCQHGDWLLFASEIKALLASGMIPVEPDLRGINHLFTFFAMPGPVTCFQGVSDVRPGHYLEISAEADDTRTLRERKYWELDFPDAGQEEDTQDEASLVELFERLMLDAIAKRTAAPARLGSYLSSGVDSGVVAALAARGMQSPLATFTVGLTDPGMDESADVQAVAKRIGVTSNIVRCGMNEVVDTYPRVVHAAESPVVDTACSVLLLLAENARDNGYGAVLTGEGADEWLASHSWFRLSKWFGWLDRVPALNLGRRVRRLFLRLTGSPLFPEKTVQRALDAVGGPNAWLDAFGIIGTAKLRFYGPRMKDVMTQHFPYDDLQLNLDRVRKWHPLNRSIYLGGRINLPGLLLGAKGDRVAMQSALQLRYPFLDEDVVGFINRLHPRWKMRGFTGKYLLRLLAQRYLPRHLAWKRKTLFMAPFERFQGPGLPPFVEQLLSPESIARTGYFDIEAVQTWRERFPQLKRGSFLRSSVELGLLGVFSTQLWHHLFIDSNLAELNSADLMQKQDPVRI